MRISEITTTVVRGLWSACELRLAESPCIEEVADNMVGRLYETFPESLVMVRAFIAAPFRSLPGRQQEFAASLAESVQRGHLLGPGTPVLSLLASRGSIEEWNDPRRSRGHVAIPLLSEEFVDSIPMMSRLLRELGLPLTWVQDPGNALERQAIGSEVGLFYVSDAPGATDDLGRKIIAAQGFVAEHGVKSVFAVGGVVFGGSVLVFIFFSRDAVEARTARTFMPFVNFLKSVLVARCSMTRIFRPVDGGVAAPAPGPGAAEAA